MDRDASAKGIEVVATFQAGDDASGRVTPGDLVDLTGDPEVVFLGERERSHIVLAMRIEASGDENRLGTKGFQCREPVGADSLAKRGAVAVGRQRNVHHALRASVDSAVRVER